MLSPEQAKERLAGFYRDDWTSRFDADVASLPDDLRALAEALTMRRDGTALSDFARVWEGLRQAEARLDRLDGAERARLFAVLFPTLAPHVEQAWLLMHGRLRQHCWRRRAFRPPGDPALGRAGRLWWLLMLLGQTRGYEQGVAWFAAWAPYLGGGQAVDTLGILFAAAIEGGGVEGEAVLAVLRDSARGEHEVGAVGRHLTRGLLVAASPEGWAVVETLLLAAQGQEGLRQVILETADEAHPEAFLRLLRLIRQHSLTRFSAVVRAVDLWLGLGWDSADARAVDRTLDRLIELLERPEAAADALARGGGEDVYLALWALALADPEAAVGPAAGLLADPDVERRFAAVHLLAQLSIPSADRALPAAIADLDLRVAARAVERADGSWSAHDDAAGCAAELFDDLERALPRFPRAKTAQPPIVWPWLVVTAERRLVARALLAHLRDRPPVRLVRHLGAMGPSERRQVAGLLAQAEPSDDASRQALFDLLGDASSWVREGAAAAIGGRQISEVEARQLEQLLARKSPGLRRTVLEMLLGQSAGRARASAERLRAARDPARRAAGEELRQRLEPPAPAATLDDGLGLFDPAQRSEPPTISPAGLVDDAGRSRLPAPRPITAAAIACLEALDALIERERNRPIVITDWQGQREALLGAAGWWFPSPSPAVPTRDDAAAPATPAPAASPTPCSAGSPRRR